MGKFSSQEIESQYNLIKMLSAEPEKYKDAIDAIKKDIAYMPKQLKKKLEEENTIEQIRTLLNYLEQTDLLKNKDILRCLDVIAREYGGKVVDEN